MNRLGSNANANVWHDSRREGFNLRQITLYVSEYTFSDAGAHVRDMFGEALYKQWLDLDCLLVQLWELQPIRPKVTYGLVPENHEKDVIDCVSYLLPETAKKGMLT